MLETLDLNKKLSKKEFKETYDESRRRLGELQRKFRDRRIPVLIIAEGLGGSGKGQIVNNLLLCWDPRGFTYHYVKLGEAERKMYPGLYHYGAKTPSRGRISIFGRGWYREILDMGVERGRDYRTFGESLKAVSSFEKQLADDGTLIIKFFLHIDEKEQKKRLLKREKDPSSAWSVTDYDWNQNKNYDKYIGVLDEIFRETDSEYASWTIVEATDWKFATCKLLLTVQKAMEARLAAENGAGIPSVTVQAEGKPLATSILDDLDLSKDLDKDEYEKGLDEYQKRLHALELEVFHRGLPVAAAFEGIDAAGKGGAIKRLAQCLYPRNYEVVPIGAPNDFEKSHHYLWRFWREMPARGQIKIFDRSWYGRVLVERVEGFARPEEWKRAYREINEMEEDMARFGTVIIKFWLQIDPVEQLKRFTARKEDPYKEWKLTDEDWRNRSKWDLYMEAAKEMLFRTSTAYAPWTVVEGNSKRFSRIKVLKTVCEAIEKAR